jgi:hypothetical protein
VGAQAAQADAHFTLATLCEAKGNFQSAEAHFRTALSCQRKIGGTARRRTRSGGARRRSRSRGTRRRPRPGGGVDPSATAENKIAAGRTSELAEPKVELVIPGDANQGGAPGVWCP